MTFRIFKLNFQFYDTDKVVRILLLTLLFTNQVTKYLLTKPVVWIKVYNLPNLYVIQ